MNLADPELELIDPTPNIYNLFIHFDKLFFWTKLASRAIVKWSKRMYSCAGVCTYEGRGGLCTITLSEPLLKLRPRKDLVETLLHEMIHAYLFVTSRDKDRDGHGPNFQAHMHRINRIASINITIYHDFHDEVELYQTHWWRCDGPCQKRRPHFGIVRRSANRAPGPSEYWWIDHKRKCGGTFIKIKEPENLKKGKKTAAPVKPNADITKYIKTKKPVNDNVPLIDQRPKSVLKDSNNIPVKTATKSNGSSTLVIPKKGVIFNPQINRPTPPLFSGTGQTINGDKKRRNSTNVIETVRNVWANKQLPNAPLLTIQNTAKSKEPKITKSTIESNVGKRNKHKAESVHVDSPPSKVKKIDDYFKNAATVLKDVYGQDFNITQSKNKLVATVTTASDLVDCPICSTKVSSSEINRHLDECLNKDVIEKLCKNTEVKLFNHQPIPNRGEDGSSLKAELKEIVDDLPDIPAYKGIPDENQNIKITSKPLLDSTDTHHIKTEKSLKRETKDKSSDAAFNSKIIKTTNYHENVKQLINFTVKKEENPDNVDFDYLPSLLDDMATKIDVPKVKIEPGTYKDTVPKINGQNCACCGNKVDKPIEEHLDECLAFFDNNTTVTEEGASTSCANPTIVIDDEDDDLDETLTLNATGTKVPCPCCLEMVEEAFMNQHLDVCLC